MEYGKQVQLLIGSIQGIVKRHKYSFREVEVREHSTVAVPTYTLRDGKFYLAGWFFGVYPR